MATNSKRITIALVPIVSIILLTPSLCYPQNPLSLSPSSPYSRPKNITFALPLIHRTSPESPFYDPKSTPETLIKEGARTSLVRNLYLSRRFSRDTTTSPPMNYDEAVEAKVDTFGVPLYSNDFVLNYSIGTPPVNTFGVLDTTSNLILLQCPTMFDPSKSSTYKNVECGSPQCNSVPGNQCSSGMCNYSVVAADEAWSSTGVLATDTTTFSRDGGITQGTVLSAALFGCGDMTANNVSKYNFAAGFIGLGNHSSSLLGQLSVTRFSYSYSVMEGSVGLIRGWIYFGQEVSLAEKTTPLVPNDFGLYFLILDGITVQGKQLDIPPEIFRTRHDGTGGFAIDTGSPYTSLTSIAFDELKLQIQAHMFDQVPEATEDFELCYRDIDTAPEIVFNFRGYDLSLCKKTNVWIEVSRGLNCLAMKRTESMLSLLGVYQQMRFLVSYDLALEQMSFFNDLSCY